MKRNWVFDRSPETCREQSTARFQTCRKSHLFAFCSPDTVLPGFGPTALHKNVPPAHFYVSAAPCPLEPHLASPNRVLGGEACTTLPRQCACARLCYDFALRI